MYVEGNKFYSII